jgi:uncharacterized membrane protein
LAPSGVGWLAGVALLTALTAALYTIFELGQQRHFLTHAFDLGIFVQAVSGYAHLGAPVSLIKEVHNGLGPHFSVLGDHFSPILAVLGPLYRLFPHAETLLVVQGLLLAASVPSVALFTARALGRPAALAITAGYARSWELQAAMARDFHEIAFAVPLLAIAIERLDAGRLRPALAAAAGLLLVKEDLGLVVAAFGILVGCRTRRGRLAALVVVGGIVATVLATTVLIPAAGGRAGYYWSYYAALGSGPVAALWHVVRHPFATVSLALHPDAKLVLLRWLFLPFGVVALGSPIVLLAMPPLAEVLVSGNPNNWLLLSHYTAVLAPILTLAAVDTVSRLRRAWRHPARWPSAVTLGYAAAVLAVAIWVCGRMPFDQLARGWWWHTSGYDRAQQAAVDLIPRGTTVEASDRLVPHLAGRAQVMLLDATPHDAAWVVFDESHWNWPLTPAVQRARPGWLLAHGYREIFSSFGVAVYHRGGAGAAG